MRVVFVCTGNTCRSPLAAAILRHEEQGVEVLSAGVMAVSGSPAAPEAIEVGREIGADLSMHRSALLSKAHVDGSLVLTLTRAHRDLVLRRFPEAAGRVFSLGEYAGRAAQDVQDPMGFGMAAYRAAADEIRELILLGKARLGWLFLGLVGTASSGSGRAGQEAIMRGLFEACCPAIDLGGLESGRAAGLECARQLSDRQIQGAIAVTEEPLAAAHAASTVPHVRVTDALDSAAARSAREQVDANFLCVDARNRGKDSVWEIAEAFIRTNGPDSRPGHRAG